MKKGKKIQKYINNHEIDLEKIIEEYSGYVYKTIRNMTGSHLSDEDIEEIISDTFFILWKNREKLDKEKILNPYIAGIVRNLVREKTRVINIHADILDYENQYMASTYFTSKELYNIDSVKLDIYNVNGNLIASKEAPFTMGYMGEPIEI